MKLKIGRFLLIVLCLCGIIGFMLFDEQTRDEYFTMKFSFYVGKEEVHTWQKDDQHYLFLPAYADLKKVKLALYSPEFEVIETGERIKGEKALKNFEYNKEYRCRSLATEEEFTLVIMKSENLLTIFMNTDSGSVEAIWADKEHDENGKLRIYSNEGTLIYTGGLSSVRARGNYSFANYEKKPFSLTLKEAASLFDLGRGRKYALLSNASDTTLIRNDIARRLESALDAEYDNIGQFVDLFANGDYLGTYYLCEKIDIGYERINITNLEDEMDRIYQRSKYESFAIYESDTIHAEAMELLPQDITGGYLVEREFADRYWLEYSENPSSFITDGSEHFIVKSPKHCATEQIEYLQDYFSEAEAAILAEDGINPDTGKSYTEYIDEDSFVKKYLVEEITKNYDAGISSMYFYKDSDSVDGRIKAAPVWDFDMSLGCYLNWMEYFSKDPTGVSRLTLHPSSSPWYDALYQKEEYYQKIRGYYENNAVPYLEDLAENQLEEYRLGLQASALMNEIRWEVDFDNNEYYDGRDAEFEQLKEFIISRKNFLDSAWIEDVPYYIVTFEVDGNIQAIRYLKEGEVLEELPQLEIDGFNGWNYNNEPIMRDTIITCK